MTDAKRLGKSVVAAGERASRQARVSVLMPTYNQATFIRRALTSLLSQSLSDWELLIIDDGCTDDTVAQVTPYLEDPRLRLIRLENNRGLGAALNCGLTASNAPYIAYLPSDDVYYEDHLTTLLRALEADPDAVLAYSGVRYHYNYRSAAGKMEGFWLQMVQVMHRRNGQRWPERHELVSDDLDRLYWDGLQAHGNFVGTGQVTAEWVEHPGQRHRLLQEPLGGINTYRARFHVPHPLRFHTSTGNFIDEIAHFRRFRERPDTPQAVDGLKIVLAGELAYNPERVLALEERGHKLYGLWMSEPYWFNYVGPLPFGHVEDIPRHCWQEALREIQPDLIYALLNWQAVPFVRQVLTSCGDIPLVWHFKEGPVICMEHGVWDDLVAIHWGAAGQIFCNPETRDWYETVMPGVTSNSPTFILDGDLPKQEWFSEERSPRLSEQDGEPHTVVPGRPIGLWARNVAELAAHGIHLHFYGDFTQKQWREWLDRTERLAPEHLHLHPHVDQGDWVREFSRYDAGWLHWQKSENQGDIRRANWDDINYPARITTLVSAGLPLLQYDNEGAIVATQNLGRKYDISLFFSTIEELGQKLRDKERLHQLQENVWRQREQFTFDYHADRLVDFFREVIAAYPGRRE